MRKHTTHWQSMLIGIIFLLICTITTNIASATTVLLEMTDKNNAPLTSGSGFFVSDTLIATIGVNLVIFRGIFKMFQCSVSACLSLNAALVLESPFYFHKSLP